MDNKLTTYKKIFSLPSVHRYTRQYLTHPQTYQFKIQKPNEQQTKRIKVFDITINKYRIWINEGHYNIECSTIISIERI